MTNNTKHNPPDLLFTESEAAHYLRVKPQTLAKWRMGASDAQIPFIKIGRSIRYRLSSLDSYLKSNTFNNTVEAHHSTANRSLCGQ